MALIGAGIMKGKEDVKRCIRKGRCYQPSMDKEEADRLYGGWLSAVKAAMAFKP